MKVKKSLLLAVLILALLAVALMLPAVASGANDKKPVAWVSYGAAAHPPEPPLGPGGIRLQSLSVHLYGDDSIRGHATLQVIKPREMRMIAMAGEGDFISAEAIGPNIFTFTASFDALVWNPNDEKNGPTRIPDWAELTCTYYDGGGPGPGGDLFSIYGTMISGEPLALGPNSPGVGDVKVHVKGEPPAGNWATWTGNLALVDGLPAIFTVNLLDTDQGTRGSEYMNWFVDNPPTFPPFGPNMTTEIVSDPVVFTEDGASVAEVIYRFDTSDWGDPSYPPYVYHRFILTDDPDPTQDRVEAWYSPNGVVWVGKFIDQNFIAGVHVFIN